MRMTEGPGSACRWVASAILLGAAFGFAGRTSGAEASPRQIRFRVPAQKLESALLQFAQQADLQLSTRSDAVRLWDTQGFIGTAPASDALAIILSGTTLEPVFLSPHTVAVREKRGSMLAEPVPETGRSSVQQLPVTAMGEAALSAPMRSIEEVVVTARRRNESLQRVPISITVFHADQLEGGTISNVQDLSLLVPNVSISGGGTTQGTAQGDFRMRGIPGVARYLDGIYLSGGQGALQSLLELERVEVLRGPQGTLFGKDSISGAIQYISKAPQPEWGARVKATAGSFDRLDLIANVDLPVSETLLTKVTAASLSRSGYVRSLSIDKDFGGYEERQFRAVALWKPFDHFKLTASLHVVDLEEDGDPQVLFGVTPALINGVPNDPYLYGLTGIPMTTEAQAAGRRETRSNQTWPSHQNDLLMFIADAEWDLSDSVELRWLSGWREYEWGHYGDSDATAYALFEQWRWIDRSELTQELQLHGRTPRFSWVAGAFLGVGKQWALQSRWQNVELQDPARRNVIQAAFPGLSIQSPRNTLSNPEDVSKALFGEGTYNVSDALSVTLGMRYSWDKVHPRSLEPCERVPVYGALSRNFCHSAVILDREEAFSRATPRISLQYEWTPDIMTYFTASQGFDAGGINTNLDLRSPPQLRDGGLFPYSPQVLTNYEIGSRSDLAGGRLRLNTSAFYGIWDDMQVDEELVPGQPGRWTTNVGEARIRGIEIEGALIIDDSWRINFGVGLLDTKYLRLGNATQLSADTAFPFAPEQSFNLGTQHQFFLDAGTLSLKAEYGWQAETWTNQDRVSRVRRPPYGLLDASVSYSPRGSMWKVLLSGTNLTDEYYRKSGFLVPQTLLDFGNVAAPREIGLTLQLEFR